MEELINGFRMIHGDSHLKLGMDAVLLAAYVKSRKVRNVCDLGCGTGAVTMLIAARHTGAHIVGVEIQESAASVAKDNVELNNVADRVRIICADMRKLESLLGSGTFSAVVSNPPYFEKAISKAGKANIERNELTVDIADVCKESSRLLENNGDMYLVHRSERLNDIFHALRAYNIEPKSVKMVHNTLGQPSKLCLITGKKNAAPGLIIESPLILRDIDGKHTAEYADIYNGGSI